MEARKRQSKPLSQSKVLVIGEFAGSHETLLTNYLTDRTKSTTFMEVLLTRYYEPGRDILRVSCYRGGKLKRSFKHGSRWQFLLRLRKTRKAFFYALTSLYLAISLLRVRQSFDICVACNIPFPIVGLLLRRLGSAQKVIFVSVTHFPPTMRLFRLADRVAHNSCNAIWYQTRLMKGIKEKEGFIKNQNIPRIIVPIGVVPEKRETLEEPIERTCVGYVGRLDDDVGLELVIEAFQQLVSKVSNAKLKIIGSGPSREKLERQVKTLGLESNVDFLGFIEDREMVRAILSKCAIAIAPYILSANSYMQYADSAKAKEYLEYGTPMIITRIPEIALEIEEKKAGFAVNYDKAEIAEAMAKLLTDDELWQECRENIRELALKYDYREIYKEAFQESGIKL